MGAIERIERPVYKAPTKGRCYLSIRAAANAEARAMLDARYPREEAEYEHGMMYYPGWHWSSDKRLVQVHKRLTRVLVKSFKLQAKGGKHV